MMDPDPITQRAYVDAKRVLSPTMAADPVSKVLDDDNTTSWPAPVPPLDDENLLQEILLRLPSKPSSLPRASLVCMRWRSILSDPEFLKRFRKHNRMPPLLGFFAGASCMTPGMKHNFVPVLDTKPDRIPAERFAVPKRSDSCDYWDFLGCRHGLAVLICECRHEASFGIPSLANSTACLFHQGSSMQRATLSGLGMPACCALTLKMDMYTAIAFRALLS